MKKITSILLLIVLTLPNISAYDEYYGTLTELENNVLTFGGDSTCEDINESDIPTIFIPGILASWYSEEGFEESKIKRWIPDPITHSYDTLFYTFKQNEYNIRDVFYKDEFSTYIDGNPNQSLYLFGYDWKKDNKVSATILSNLVLQIREKYQELNGCDIGTVNIIGHSMGGLVARTMLEDMCVGNNELLNYYDRKGLQKGEIKEFKSVKCNNYTKVNQLITISTPHRGSPGSFPMWTKGDMLQTTALFQTMFLKGQLGTLSDTELYNVIHGNTSKVPNGIVTIGQLLPDIKENNNFNKELIYLNQKGKKLDNKTHPVNSFLEELNSDENIEKMFNNINKKHTLYYSTITSNVNDFWKFTKNNIVGFELEDKYLAPVTGNLIKDKTSTYRGKDIYSTYSEIPRTDVYNIDNKIINSKGFGGDGTVPSKNLLLTLNDTGKRPDTSKYESIEIKCYDNELLSKNIYDLEESEEILSKKVGKLPMELCSHTKMPMLTAVKVFEEISGIDITNDKNGNYSLQKEQELLYKYLGYADYTDTVKNLKNGVVDNGYGGSSNYVDGTYNYVSEGIKNSDELSYRFLEGVFNTTFKNQKEIDDFIDNKDKEGTKRKELTFDGQGGAVDSLLRYEILSPINLIIEDEQGRKIGIDPETGLIINEIPGAWTSGDTEGSNEPEFFLIPRTGTGEVNHKITSYPTGEGGYHIVLNEIKTSPQPSPLEEMEQDHLNEMVIEGYAKEGIIEEYEVGINDKNATFRKSGVSRLRLDRKYKDILEKIIGIIEDKYIEKQKKRLGYRLSKFKELGYGKFSGNEKIVYLVGELVEYLR